MSSAFVFLGRLYFVLFWTFSFWLCFWFCCVCTPMIVLLWTLSFWICFVCWYVHQWFYTKAWDGCVAVSICAATEPWTRWNVSPPTATSCIRMVLSRSNSIDTSGCDRRTSFRKSSGLIDTLVEFQEAWPDVVWPDGMDLVEFDWIWSINVFQCLAGQTQAGFGQSFRGETDWDRWPDFPRSCDT